MRISLLLLAFVSTQAWSQVEPLPRDMGLPESSYVRPDPSELQLSLENGLVAYVAEAGQVPLVTMSAFVRVGAISDDKQGTVEALAEALKNNGPSTMTVDDFKKRLQFMTADYTVDLHDEWMEITLNVPTEDLEGALDMFAAVLRDPEIDAGSIERAAGSAAPEAADLGGESGAVLYEGSMGEAVDRFYDVIYAGHPYGDKPSGDDFEMLEPADVQRFHAEYFVPGNLTIAVAGDIDVDAINNRLADLFGDWSAAAVPDVRQLPDVRRKQAALHHFPLEKLQSWLVIGHDLPLIPEDEQAAFDVMDYIMGAYHLNTRLMRETRYKYGYTNDASSFPEDRWHGPGGYTYRSYSRPEVIQNIYRNMMGELIRIREEEVSEHEMFVAKGALADGLFQVRYLDGYTSARSFALEKLRYGDHERSATYVDRVRAVTRKDVLEAARKYIDPQHMQVVLLGRDAIALDR